MSLTIPHLAVRAITKRFGTSTVLDGISIEAAAGEFLALIGPSGCGKSTLLRVISGLEAPDEGQIVLTGRDVTAMRAADRDIAMVFQSYALYPHLTARQNMAVPLAMRRLTARQRLPLLGRLFGSREACRGIAAEIEAAAAVLKITPLLDRKPSQMSGGQRQRVALGRAIVRHPQLFLMDEPLSNLDVALRVHMRGEIVDLHRRLGTTTVYVTHDQAEALSMADRIAVVMHGRLLQVARPDVIYQDPEHLDVAEFVGSPKINVLAADIGPDGAARRGGEVLAQGFGHAAGGPVRLAIRPEHLDITDDNRPGALPARIDRMEFQGSELLAHLRLQDGGEAMTCRLPPHRGTMEMGRTVGLVGMPSGWLAFGQDGARIRPSATIIQAADRQAAGRQAVAHG